MIVVDVVGSSTRSSPSTVALAFGAELAAASTGEDEGRGGDVSDGAGLWLGWIYGRPLTKMLDL